jgi:hypothetical protein
MTADRLGEPRRKFCAHGGESAHKFDRFVRVGALTNRGSHKNRKSVPVERLRRRRNAAEGVPYTWRFLFRYCAATGTFGAVAVDELPWIAPSCGTPACEPSARCGGCLSAFLSRSIISTAVVMNSWAIV